MYICSVLKIFIVKIMIKIAIIVGIILCVILTALWERIAAVKKKLDSFTDENGNVFETLNVELSPEDIKRVAGLCMEEFVKKTDGKNFITTKDVKKIVQIADELLPKNIEDAMSAFPNEDEYYETIYKKFKEE